MKAPGARPGPGIHLAHKPVGASSFELVRALRERAAEAGKIPPICHGGVLDPFAEGLVLLLVGPATRLMEHLHAAPKTYVAEIAWGVETDTCDLKGKEVARGDPSALTPGSIEAALASSLGWRDQVPPAFSNKRVGGERAWERAARGEEVALPPSRVYLHSARVLSHALPAATRVELVCRGGYYVRSLARDLGRALGCRAHVAALARTAIGPWRDPGPGGSARVTGPAVLPWCPRRFLGDAEVGELRAGRAIVRGEVQPPEWPLPPGFPEEGVVVLGVHQGRLVALLKRSGERLAPEVDLRRGL